MTTVTLFIGAIVLWGILHLWFFCVGALFLRAFEIPVPFAIFSCVVSATLYTGGLLLPALENPIKYPIFIIYADLAFQISDIGLQFFRHFINRFDEIFNSIQEYGEEIPPLRILFNTIEHSGHLL